jgi:hypothetical protein
MHARARVDDAPALAPPREEEEDTASVRGARRRPGNHASAGAGHDYANMRASTGKCMLRVHTYVWSGQAKLTGPHHDDDDGPPGLNVTSKLDSPAQLSHCNWLG